MFNWNTTKFDTADISYLIDQVYENGKFQFKSIDFYREIPENHIMQLCHEKAHYLLPTIELVGFLKNLFADKKVIEIGSGNGFLADKLNILATDSYMQNQPNVNLTYQLFGQPTVKYGKNVITIDANAAVKKYEPDITLACWVTQKLLPGMDSKTGANMYGVVEEDIIRDTKLEYVFIGHKMTHKDKTILRLPHETIEFDGLVSRNGFKDNVIWRFRNG